MLAAFNRYLEAWMPLVTPVSVVLGLVMANELNGFVGAVPWIFALITFSGSIGLSLRDFRTAIARPLPIILTMLNLHLLMPLIAMFAGRLFFPGDPLIVTGMILLLLVPTGIVSFMWVSIFKGLTALTLSIILLDTLLSPFIVPWMLSALIGTHVEINAWGMMKGLLWMVLVPSVLGIVINHFSAGKAKLAWGPVLSPLSKLCLAVVIMINSAVIAPYFRKFDLATLHAAGLILILIIIGYMLGWLISLLLRSSREVQIVLTFNSGMRNISAGAVLAVSFFPPPVAYPAIIGMLFQQMTASLIGTLLFRGRRSRGADQQQINRKQGETL